MQLYTIKNKNGLKAAIAGDGARMVSLLVPDKLGRLVDVVFNTPEMDGCRVSDARQPDEYSVELNCSSKNEGDYSAGSFNIKLVYALNDNNCLKITCEAVSTALIQLNPPNYTFFNLNGNGDNSILKHQLFIKADVYMPVDKAYLPTGHTEPVTGTPFDFRKSAIIGARINDHHWQLNNGNGYCHYFVLNKHAPRTPVAKLKGDKSGIIMEVFTDQPKLHFCSGHVSQNNFGCAARNKKDGAALAMFGGDFDQNQLLSPIPTIVLKPDNTYKSVCSYLFKN